MKKLYEFTLHKNEEVEVTEEEKNKDGEIVKITKKQKQQVPYKFFIRKPNRPINDEAELFYAAKLADAIKAGLLTYVQLKKRFENDGGTLSEVEKQEYLEWVQELYDTQNNLYRLTLVEKRSDEEDKQLKDVIVKIAELRDNIRRFEMSQSALFDQTAETYARNKIVIWYVMHLSYKIDGDKELPLFGEGNLDDKLAKYDEYEESEDTFIMEILRKCIFIVTLWYMGTATNQEEFAKMIEQWDRREKAAGISTPLEPKKSKKTSKTEAA